MKKKIVALIIITFLIISCKDNQTKKKNTILKQKNIEINFIEPKKINPFKKLIDCVQAPLYNVEEIDFTGDKIPDYICKIKPNQKGIGIEYWISSDFKIIRKDVFYDSGFTYRRFANLDNDIEPEIFEIEGDEDWISYTFYNLNLTNGKRKVLLYLNPIINDGNKNYWVNTENKLSLITRNNNGQIELMCSLKNLLLKEDDEDLPMSQKEIPVIYFKGNHNQNFIKQKINKSEWLPLERIIKLTEK